MQTHQRILLLILILLLIFSAGGGSPAQAADWTFEISGNPDLFSAPGPVDAYVFFSRGRSRSSTFSESGEPRGEPDWFHPEPFLRLRIESVSPASPIRMSLEDPAVFRFPPTLTSQNLVGLQAQAVLRTNPDERQIGEGPGNAYGRVVSLGQPGTVRLTLDRTVPPPRVVTSDWFQQVRLRSDLLSEFHGRDIFLTAYVQLPASYHRQPQRRYPVIYEVPGFGWSYPKWPHREPVRETNSSGVEFLRVLLDPNCRLGHHVFANSANNGPYGDALVQELIPELDRRFRTVGTGETRFLTGHSSGGWSSLWLQVNYPETFGGVWSTAPDSVDFRDFQKINLYRPGENFFTDPEGKRRPIARMNGQPVLWCDTFSQMEEVLGDGGQLASFEAVFSPRGEDGQPRPLWNRKTGAIDPVTVEAWKDFDIRLLLESNWNTLGPQLAGKIHVFMGTEDTFYLEGATRLLKESLARQGSDAVIELVPGRSHFDLVPGRIQQRIDQQMAEQFLKVSRPVLQSR